MSQESDRAPSPNRPAWVATSQAAGHAAAGELPGHGMDVTYEYDDHIGYPPPTKPARRWWVWGVILLVLLVGGTGAFLWQSLGLSLPAFSSVMSDAKPAAEDGPVALKDYQAFQRQIAGQMQSVGQLLTAQQAETRRLSEQIAGLTAKIDDLQRATAPAPVAAPPAPVAAAVAPPVRKRPAPKPPAGISVGGAPIPQAGRN